MPVNCRRMPELAFRIICSQRTMLSCSKANAKYIRCIRENQLTYYLSSHMAKMYSHGCRVNSKNLEMVESNIFSWSGSSNSRCCYNRSKSSNCLSVSHSLTPRFFAVEKTFITCIIAKISAPTPLKANRISRKYLQKLA